MLRDGASVGTHPVRVLLVDDDPKILEVVAKLLERHGHQVACVPDGLRGWEILQSQPVDLVITDRMLPHMDGISFVKRIRTDDRYRKLPVIMITAYEDEASFDEGLREGVGFVLKKPIDFDRLLSLVRFAE